MCFLVFETTHFLTWVSGTHLKHAKVIKRMLKRHFKKYVLISPATIMMTSCDHSPTLVWKATSITIKNHYKRNKQKPLYSLQTSNVSTFWKHFTSPSPAAPLLGGFRGENHFWASRGDGVVARGHGGKHTFPTFEGSPSKSLKSRLVFGNAIPEGFAFVWRYLFLWLPLLEALGIGSRG